MTAYEKIFKDKTGIIWSNEFEIHHLDLNHDNNNFENLVLIPIQLHRIWHNELKRFNERKEEIIKCFDADFKRGEYGTYDEDKYLIELRTFDIFHFIELKTDLLKYVLVRDKLAKDNSFFGNCDYEEVLHFYQLNHLYRINENHYGVGLGHCKIDFYR